MQKNRITLPLGGHVRSAMCLGPTMRYRLKNDASIKVERVLPYTSIEGNWELRKGVAPIAQPHKRE